MNSLNLRSLKGSRFEEKLYKPLLSEQNCHHYTGKKRQPTIETHKDSIITVAVTNTPKFSKVLEKSSKIANKKGSFSDNKVHQKTSYTGTSKSNLISIQSSRRGSQINQKEIAELPASSISERPSKKTGQIVQKKDIPVRKTTTPTKSVPSTSFSKSDKKASIIEQQRRNIQERRLSYNPVLEGPIRRDNSHSVVKNSTSNNGSTAGNNRYNKENNYNFSFTEREILEGQTC